MSIYSKCTELNIYYGTGQANYGHHLTVYVQMYTTIVRRCRILLHSSYQIETLLQNINVMNINVVCLYVTVHLHKLYQISRYRNTSAFRAPESIGNAIHPECDDCELCNP